jgi:uncharacterized membrane protein
MDEKLLMFALFSGSGLLLALLAIPLILCKIKPNILYGFRTPKTLGNPQIWYQANTYAGWRLLWTGIIVIAASVALFAFPQVDLLTYSLAILGVVCLSLTITLVQSFLYLRKL